MGLAEKIRRFEEVTLADRATVGGKGGVLGELARAGIPVPAGFIIATSAFEQVLSALEDQDAVRSQVEGLAPQDLNAITAVSSRLRLGFERVALPEDLRAAITAAQVELSGHNPSSPVAVRSSATSEDREDASFAGLQDTYLWVQGEQAIVASIRSCWSSLYSIASISYRRKHGIPEAGMAIAVVVQKMVHARSAGVMFTRSPVSGDRSVVTIEATWGLGSALVSGQVTPDRFVISKITDEISIREIADKHVQDVPAAGGGVEHKATPQQIRRAPSVTDQELATLKEIAGKLEHHFARPQDIEWAIDHSGHIYILQSRPETVWSLRGQAPVAKPAENPFLHVMNIFGGRR
jgi:pyruvate, water dikinase